MKRSRRTVPVRRLLLHVIAFMRPEGVTSRIIQTSGVTIIRAA